MPLLERIGALYRDTFMAGFSLRDSPEFDDWQAYQAAGGRPLPGAVGAGTSLGYRVGGSGAGSAAAAASGSESCGAGTTWRARGAGRAG